MQASTDGRFAVCKVQSKSWRRLKEFAVKLDVGLGIQDGASTARRMALAILPAYVLAAIVGMVSAAYASANFASILALLAP